MFVLLLTIQPLFRLRPVAKSEDMLPRVAALTAVGIPLTFILLDRAPSSVAFNLTSVVLSLFANVACLVTAAFLGRSLSVMPEARRLVRTGPYATVRHPLYLFEILGTGAVALQYRSLPAVGLLLVAIGLQLARARWEEGVLDGAFDDFAVYRAETSFLLPSKPLRFFASFAKDVAARRLLALIVAAMLVTLALIAATLQRLSV
jgi:protein-S-isoprenylcysteine O-methyltransferase Ste14